MMEKSCRNRPNRGGWVPFGQVKVLFGFRAILVEGHGNKKWCSSVVGDYGHFVLVALLHCTWANGVTGRKYDYRPQPSFLVLSNVLQVVAQATIAFCLQFLLIVPQSDTDRFSDSILQYASTRYCWASAPPRTIGLKESRQQTSDSSNTASVSLVSLLFG